MFVIRQVPLELFLKLFVKQRRVGVAPFPALVMVSCCISARWPLHFLSIVYKTGKFRAAGVLAVKKRAQQCL